MPPAASTVLLNKPGDALNKSTVPVGPAIVPALSAAPTVNVIELIFSFSAETIKEIFDFAREQQNEKLSSYQTEHFFKNMK